ncbi:hypothetical protein [Streptomyces sp. CAU 1734]|uniref:hypothetical protein n=1 Tax=Streptomyces sp. CAU 1734 TaxID=3140360 RepID=UPI0032602B18
MRDQFPDGQLFADPHSFERDSTSTAEGLAGFLRAHGVPDHRIPVDLSEWAAQYRSLLSGRRMLVVLDDVRTAVSVRPLPGGPGTNNEPPGRARLGRPHAHHQRDAARHHQVVRPRCADPRGQRHGCTITRR